MHIWKCCFAKHSKSLKLTDDLSSVWSEFKLTMDNNDMDIKRRRIGDPSGSQTSKLSSPNSTTSSQMSGSQLFSMSPGMSSQILGKSPSSQQFHFSSTQPSSQISATSSQQFGTSSQSQPVSQTTDTPGSQISHSSGKRRTKGAHIGGQKYEMYVATMLGVRGIDLQHNFKLETNIGETTAGNMDDLVYQLDDRTYYLQLKHSENPENSKFQPADMMDLLYSCMKSFYTITKNKTADKCVFIIFTNKDLGPNLQKTYQTLTMNVDDFLLTDRSVNKIFKFKYCDKIYNSIQNHKTKDKKHGGLIIDQNTTKEFLNNIILITCQKGRDDIKSIIIDTIRKCDSVRVSPRLYEQLFDNLMVYVEDWWERGSPELNSNLMHHWLVEAKTKVFESLLTEINEQNKLIDVNFNIQELQSMKSRLSASHLIQVTSSCLKMTCTKVIQSLNVDQMNEEQYICISDAAILRRRTEVLYAWQGGIWNWLIVCWNGQVDNDLKDEVERISLERTDKMAIFITDDGIELPGFWKICDDFSLDQIEGNSVQHVLEQPLNFQGETVLLQELLGGNLDLQLSITAQHVVDILSDQKPIIGKQLEKQVHYYIDRSLQSNVYVSFDILKDTSISDRFAVSGISEKQLKQMIPEGETIGYYYDSLGKGFYNGTNQDRYIILNWKFQSLIESIEMNRSLHWLSVEGNKLKWKGSSSSPNSLTHILNKYLEVGMRERAVDWISRYIAKLGLDNQIQNEELCANTAWELDGCSMLVIAEPGMGKTTYITKIAFDTKHDQPTSWVIRINWNEHTQFLNHINQSGWSVEDIFKLLWKCISGKELTSQVTASLEYTLFSYSDNLVLLLDGFDEISPTYTEIALELLQILLQEKKVKKLWVTSRPVMREKIEQALDTISFGITPLTEKNQWSLLLQLWNLRDNEQSTLLDDFIREMLSGANYYLNDKNFSTIPLHLMMLAMAFESDMKQTLAIKQVCLPEQFKVLDIYQKFIEKKREIYITDKNKADISNVGTIDAYETVWEIIEKNHMRSALFVLFNQYLDILSDNKIESKTKEFVSRIMEGKDRAGVVVQVVEEKPFFVHRTFAEYFAAKWFVKYYRKNRSVLAEVLCEEINKVMRDMMDHILVADNKLNWAVLNREEDVVITLLEDNEVDVNAVDKGGRNALHMVVGRSIETVTPLLIQKGISADAVDDVLTWTPAQYAIMIEDWKSAGMLLDAETNVKCHPEPVVRKLTEVNVRKSTAMHAACSDGYIKLVDLLVKHGADINKAITYIQGKPLHVAVDMNHLELVKWLVDHGADKDSTDQNEETPFFYAVLRGNVFIAEFFLKTGWGRSVLTRSEETPFHTVSMTNSKKMTELLIESGKFSISQPDVRGQMPLHYASAYGNQQVMRCLVNNGADINAQDHAGMTALHLAAQTGKMSALVYLLEQQTIDTNKRDNENCSPLHYAATIENHFAVQFMLEEQGIEVECRDINGCTPLHYAAREGRLKAVELLLNMSTDKNPRDNQNRTPLHLAVEHAHFQVIKYLIENASADVNCMDNAGNTPLSIAHNLINEEEKQQILQYFQSLE